jgi:hypothetical protein
VPRVFSPATAEQVVAAVEAVLVRRSRADASYVSEFLDMQQTQVEAALELAVDIGFLTEQGGLYEASSPLCKFVATPNEQTKAAVLRVLIESYEPFVVFRARLEATTAANAAHETKVLLQLDAHREQIKDTLISLGTYSGALVTQGGGHYRLEDASAPNPLETLALAAGELASAESRIRKQMGSNAAGVASRDEVIIPLAEALIKASQGDVDGAVVTAGNAVESYLVEAAARLGVNLAGATGINAKLERFKTAGKLPAKLVFFGKYLGHIRNAADHGIDADVGASWTIQATTGVEYPFVACSFISAARASEVGSPPHI